MADEDERFPTHALLSKHGKETLSPLARGRERKLFRPLLDVARAFLSFRPKGQSVKSVSVVGRGRKKSPRPSGENRFSFGGFLAEREGKSCAAINGRGEYSVVLLAAATGNQHSLPAAAVLAHQGASSGYRP